MSSLISSSMSSFAISRLGSKIRSMRSGQNKIDEIRNGNKIEIRNACIPDAHMYACLSYVSYILIGNDLRNKQCKYEKLIKLLFLHYLI